MSKILILAAHPDDETIGCGGTIRKFHEEGYHIELLTFTDGESARGENKINRNKVTKDVAQILGINRHIYADFPDNAMDQVSFLDVVKFIEEHVDYYPDIIFTHSLNDLNIDHQIVAKATFTAFRPQKGHKHKIYSYYIPSSTDYNPTNYFLGNTFVQLNENQINSKLQALKYYDKEMRAYPHSRSYENINNLMKVWGSEVGLNYAEKFSHIRTVI